MNNIYKNNGFIRSISTITKYFIEDKWLNYICKNKFNLLNKQSIEYSLKQFWKDIMKKLSNDKFIYLLLRVKYQNNDCYTLGIMQKINNKDYNELLTFYIKFLTFKKDNYLNDTIDTIIITYKIIPDEKLLSKESKIGGSIKQQTKIESFKFLGYNLPNSIDYTILGEIIQSNGNIIIIKNSKTNYFYNIIKYETHNFIQIKFKDQIIIEYKDYLDDPYNLGTFTRKIKNHEYKFIDGKLIVKKLERQNKFIKSIKQDKDITNKFITLDIETRVIGNTILPYCLCYFDGKNTFSYYLTDYINEKSMLKEAILSLFNKKEYHNHIVYIHNLSFFDGIFLLNVLASIENITVKPLMKDGKMFNIELKLNNIKINLRDSLLMLPNSLKKLAIQFNVDNKGIFPYDFVNNNIDLNYIGKIPKYKYFKDLLKIDYVKYVQNHIQNLWNLKDETIKYCIQDCVSLHQVIIKFNYLIFDQFNLNIHRFPTFSSLALGIYRCNYLKDNKIPIISG